MLHSKQQLFIYIIITKQILIKCIYYFIIFNLSIDNQKLQFLIIEKYLYLHSCEYCVFINKLKIIIIEQSITYQGF